MNQLALLDDAPAPRDRTWTREPVDLAGTARYVIMIRAPGDPERRSREDRRAELGDAASTAWKSLAKVSVEAWAERFMALLADGREATFNALCVELADVTADVAPDAAEFAMWRLKAAGKVEHTIDAPVLWRAVA